MKSSVDSEDDDDDHADVVVLLFVLQERCLNWTMRTFVRSVTRSETH